jgi:type IV pilus assembly protein PilX
MNMSRTDPAGRSKPPALRPWLALRARRQHGYVMVISMLILLLIMIMSISMAKSFFLEEGMAGNIREKTRSSNAAQAALAYGEWFVDSGSQSSYGVNCPATPAVLTTATICTNAVALNTTPNATTTPFKIYFPLPASSYMTISTAGGQDTFYALPGVYIQYLGLTGQNYIYLITAYGYGGSLNSLSIIQSTYLTQPASQAL